MKAHELKVGNWVYWDKYCNNELRQIQLDEGYLEVLFGARNYDDYKPIPLTEEWLPKFGFEKKHNGEYIKARYNIYKPVEYVNYLFCENNLVLREIKYVHTLQNLYFALTGIELKINLLI